ncbi:MAG: ribonuclease HI [Deltaproteobacteria bacterium]|nr:ribonuclease HI [Deltaproteobacteria bacterium]
MDLAGRRGEESAVQLWTDGACSGNPGPAGLGVRYDFRGEVHERAEYLGSATNNIAELTAILRGLELVLEQRGDLSGPIDVMTDSEYCIGLLGLGWKAKANQELVARLRALYDRCEDVLLVKVKGHAGVPGNERADELARLAIETRRTTVI